MIDAALFMLPPLFQRRHQSKAPAHNSEALLTCWLALCYVLRGMPALPDATVTTIFQSWRNERIRHIDHARADGNTKCGRASLLLAYLNGSDVCTHHLRTSPMSERNAARLRPCANTDLFRPRLGPAMMSRLQPVRVLQILFALMLLLATARATALPEAQPEPAPVHAHKRQEFIHSGDW
ncbi:hypothetical protein NM688_g5127 [Phlebia brevispora]|uniref:Uncharacterized protein n=1 Tax=Phlebia brevispora TaxID=194682 RepID=A0ACC1T0D8_9APHY|nr:hypothetical protein NM688_g5127 [Phlebia brevispora]